MSGAGDAFRRQLRQPVPRQTQWVETVAVVVVGGEEVGVLIGRVHQPVQLVVHIRDLDGSVEQQLVLLCLGQVTDTGVLVDVAHPVLEGVVVGEMHVVVDVGRQGHVAEEVPDVTEEVVRPGLVAPGVGAQSLQPEGANLLPGIGERAHHVFDRVVGAPVGVPEMGDRDQGAESPRQAVDVVLEVVVLDTVTDVCVVEVDLRVPVQRQGLVGDVLVDARVVVVADVVGDSRCRLEHGRRHDEQAGEDAQHQPPPGAGPPPVHRILR